MNKYLGKSGKTSPENFSRERIPERAGTGKVPVFVDFEGTLTFTRRCTSKNCSEYSRVALRTILYAGIAYSALFRWFPSVACAADLKIVDASGLVRSAKVVQDDGDVEVTLGGESQSGTTCTLKNVDGLAPDQSVTASSSDRCVFSRIPAGTWQLSTSKPSKWQVRITGDK